MKEASENLYAFLSGDIQCQAVLGDDFRLYPAIAPKDVMKPFAIYTISSESGSMDGRINAGVVSVYFDGNAYTEMVAFVDTLQSIFDAGDSAYECTDIETGYSERYDTMSANININIY